MRKLWGMLAMSVSAPVAASACSMAFPAYGVYSAGTWVLGTRVDWNFAWVLGGAILLKAVSYAALAGEQRMRLFGAMWLANVVTTATGLLLEMGHVAMAQMLFLPAFGMWFLFAGAAKKLWPLGYTTRWPKLSRAHVVSVLTLAYLGLGIWGFVIPEMRHAGAGYWLSRWGFSCGALVIALVVTTSYEYSMITRLLKREGREVFLPVLKANLIVFFVLFAAVAGVLWSQHRLPNP